MAEGLAAFRRQYAKVVCGTMGVGAPNRRQLEGEVYWSGREGQMLALPQDVAAYSTLQDPLTGEFPFMIGFSTIGGPDEIA
jgi:hypothetical protein